MNIYLVLFAAMAIDAIFGDQPAWYRTVPHPVAAIGKGIAWLETRLNHHDHSNPRRLLQGTVAVVIVIAITTAVGEILQSLFSVVVGGQWLEALVVSTLIAGRSLWDHVRAVAVGLDRSIEDGRKAVAHIVGRNTRSLNYGEVARAAIESTAENFSDGVVAPALWYLVFGLPGICAYKAINTLDSMIGHHNQRYEWFGKVAAHLDDIVNWIPARTSALLLCMAALLLPRARAGYALVTILRDASKHRSINAGWPEAAMAGALDFSLAGSRRYGTLQVNDPWIGSGRTDLQALDVYTALHLYGIACMLLGAALLLLAMMA